MANEQQFHEQSVTEVKEMRLSIGQKLCFGAGDWLNTMTYGMIAAFLMAFLTDNMLVPMGAVALIMSLSKVWDAVNDPLIGIAIDKSRSKHGVYRPWLIRMMVPFAITNILLWVPISKWGNAPKITYVAIVYCAYMVFFTAYHIAYGSLAGTMTQNTEDRGQLFGFRLGFSQLMFWGMSTAWIPMVAAFGKNGNPWATFIVATIFTVPGFIFAVLLFKVSREVVEPPKSTKLPAKQLGLFVVKNPALIMTMLGQFVNGIYSYGRQAVQIYYFTYYAGNVGLFTVYNFISIGCGIAGPFTAPLIQKAFGNKGKAVALGCIGSGALFIVMYWINAGTNPVLFFILAGISGYFNGIVMASVYACMLDTIEVGELKTGIRASAFAVSLCHFANKLGMAISTGVVGAMLAGAGFVANQAQNAQVLGLINGWFTYIPGIIGVVIGIIFLFYKLSTKKYYEILTELKEKHGITE